MRPIQDVLIARSAFGEQYEPACARALNELGIWTRIFDVHSHLPGLMGRVQERILWGPGIRRANEDLVVKVEAEKPDVTLLYMGHHFERQTLEQIRPFTFLSGAHNDDPTGPRNTLLRYRLLRRALPAYQGYHAYRECNVAELLAVGVPRVKVLMAYYLPWADYPRSLSGEERKRWGCDVVFAGHPEPDDRVGCLSAAARAGFSVRVYGYVPYWRKWLPRDVHRLVQPQPTLAGEDYRKALCGARIVSCFFSRWNRDQYTRRVFEAPASGAFLLAERTAVMEQLYEEGKEAEYFASPEEFVEKVRFYLKDESARRSIAEAGYKRATTSGYDVHSRMRQWLADVTEWRNECI